MRKNKPKSVKIRDKNNSQAKKIIKIMANIKKINKIQKKR